MKRYTAAIIAGVVGIACGLVSHTYLLEGKWFNLIVWAIAGIVLGLFVLGRRQIVVVGVVYGIFLSVTFLLSDFQGTPGNLPGFLVLTLLLSVVGAVAGVVTVFIGSWLRARFR